MRNIKNIILGTIALIGVSSCTDYLDVNENLNNPKSSSNINKSILLPAAMTDTHAGKVVFGNIYANVLVNNWTGNFLNFSGAFNEWQNLEITPSDVNIVWARMYLGIAEYDNIITTSTDAKDDYYKAIALISKSFYMQTIVDLWGDVPYSEAFKFGENLNPAYDNEVDIYRALVKNINEAIDLIVNADQNIVSSIGGEDVIFNGNMAKWIKFGNTVKLRLLVRQSDLLDSDTTTYINQEKATLLQNGGLLSIGENVTINPGYSSGNLDKFNPFYAQFHDASFAQTGWYDQSAASEYAVKYLKGDFTTVADRRLTTLYSPLSNGDYLGLKQGDIKSDIPNVDKVSGIGYIPFKGGATGDGVIFTSAESYFLQAEAVLKNIIPGNAKALFELGVSESFAYHNLTGFFTSYMSLANNVDGLGWDASSNKIQAIMRQKWIALNSIDALESFIEHNRTGYPIMPLSTKTTKTKRPNRFPYPDSEYSGNTANTPVLTLNDLFTQSIFWDTTN